MASTQPTTPGTPTNPTTPAGSGRPAPPPHPAADGMQPQPDRPADSSELGSPNDDQERFWNEVAGPLWVAWEDDQEQHAAPFGEAALRAAAPTTGERVIDVGCGYGVTTVALGHAVGPTGAVLGVDLSSVLLARAMERARAAALPTVTFRRADAQTDDLGTAAFDLVFSRFGVMFFADPVAAFGNLRRALRPGGRLTFVCWQPPSANPWMALPNRAALQVYGLTPPPHDAPGPFSLADPARIETALGAAGFASIEIRPDHRTLDFGVGLSVEEWAHRRLLTGPARQQYLAGNAETQRETRRLVGASVASYRVTDRLRMHAAAWIVTARR